MAVIVTVTSSTVVLGIIRPTKIVVLDHGIGSTYLHTISRSWTIEINTKGPIKPIFFIIVTGNICRVVDLLIWLNKLHFAYIIDSCLMSVNSQVVISVPFSISIIGNLGDIKGTRGLFSLEKQMTLRVGTPII